MTNERKIDDAVNELQELIGTLRESDADERVAEWICALNYRIRSTYKKLLAPAKQPKTMMKDAWAAMDTWRMALILSECIPGMRSGKRQEFYAHLIRDCLGSNSGVDVNELSPEIRIGVATLLKYVMQATVHAQSVGMNVEVREGKCFLMIVDESIRPRANEGDS